MAERKTDSKKVVDAAAQESVPWEDAEQGEAGTSSVPAVREPEEAGSLTLGSRQYTDTPALDPDDVLVPRLRLAQGLSAEVQDGFAKPGEWLLMGHEPSQEVVVVPFMYGKLRELRSEDEGRDILCFSRDSITGEGEPGGECKTCPMNRWSEDRTGKRVPPACSVFFSYLCYSVTHDAPVVMEFRRTGLNAARQINSIIQARKIGTFGLTLAQASNRGPKGTYYVPTVSLKTLAVEEIEDYRSRLMP